MSLFKCEGCGVVVNTALSLFWVRGDGPALCSLCDPQIGEWHGCFEREDADQAGYVLRDSDYVFIERGKA